VELFLTKFQANTIVAIKSGPVPKPRDLSKVPIEKMTAGEKVVAFAHEYLHVPEGMHTGERLALDEWQVAFILAIFDNPSTTRLAICSLGRRNGKSFVVAVILLAYILGPLAERNRTFCSAALTRDQAGLIYRLCEKMLALSPALKGLYKCVPSSKKIIGLAKNTEYRALSADGSSNLGQSFNLVLLDEAGQIRGPTNPFVEMLETSQGSFSDEQRPLMIILSTQAANDSDYLSLKIDDAIRSKNPKAVCHLYCADQDSDIMDRSQWYKANPGLGKYRSETDLEEQLKQAIRIPSTQNSALNLLLNQRISLQSLWIAPSVWKENAGAVDSSLFGRLPVHIGLDLSQRSDLTAAVAAVSDPETGKVHLRPWVFIPADGLSDKARRDRAPYDAWVRDGLMVAVPGKTIDYAWVSEFLRKATSEMLVASVQFDRWGIEHFRQAAIGAGFEPESWIPVGQGYRDFSPRLSAFETALLQRRICHGAHPLLNMAVANAIAVQDPSGNKKLDKSATSQRIDPIVAAVMAAFPCTDAETAAFDISGVIG
jgi:phage terminase large subunit-like protein